jgi:hypothetical protein
MVVSSQEQQNRNKVHTWAIHNHLMWRSETSDRTGLPTSLHQQSLSLISGSATATDKPKRKKHFSADERPTGFDNQQKSPPTQKARAKAQSTPRQNCSIQDPKVGCKEAHIMCNNVNARN